MARELNSRQQGLPAGSREQRYRSEASLYAFDGNAARQLSYAEAAPQLIPEELPELPQRQPERRRKPRTEQRPSKKQLQKNRERALAMSGPELLILAVSLVVLVSVVIGYLQLQTSIDKRLNEIQQLENEISSLRVQNDARELELTTQINYQDIYDTAINILGMYYPGKEQVLHYTSLISEYFEYGEAIPSN